MKTTIINSLMNLIKVKSIVTILLTIVFCFLAVKQVISGTDFQSVFLIVISFYFGTQTQKNVNGTSE